MHIEYTRHAELKLKERRISKSEVNAIINDPDEILLDIETGNLVAVGNMESKPDHKLIVVYSHGEIIKLVTIINASKTDIVKTREKNGRWVKIG